MDISNINLITFDKQSQKNSFYASYTHKIREKKTHWHDFYEIHLITEGTMTEYINGHKFEMEAGWLYLLKPYDVHEYCCKQPNKLYKIQFLIDILDENIQQTLMLIKHEFIMQLPKKAYSTLLPFFDKLVEEYNSNKLDSPKMVQHLINCLTLSIIRLGKYQIRNHAKSDPIVMALKYIHKNYTNNITLQQVAAYTGLTPNYFCSKFHKEVGQSFKQYLKGLQLNHAATLLRVTNDSISAVCTESGINSFAHFLADFKAYYGVTPSQYRKQSK